ncbi:MAG: TIGR02147 family protein [Chitinivibrionales bacterium]|nr:TIGR02147 family protein [Chitinivibrionales bacterium]
MPEIFTYFDYHKFLADYYEAKKKENFHFSFRFIAQHIGIDPGYLVKVFQGHKNLSSQSLPAIASLLKLNKKETEYFELLVLFGKARAPNEIKHYFEKLLAYADLDSRKIEADKYEFYQKWYYTPIRELIRFYPFTGDFKALARMVLPAIRPTEAQKAVELLQRLGLIKKGQNGVYQLTSRFITTGDEWNSIAVRTFQKATIELAESALDRIPKEERDISTVTVSVSREGMAKLKEKLAKVRREILEIAHQEKAATRTYHVNLALFPITRDFDDSENKS